MTNRIGISAAPASWPCALAVAVALLLGVAGCRLTAPYDHRVPAARSMWAACPKGDDGRVQDKWLRWPDQWECVK